MSVTLPNRDLGGNLPVQGLGMCAPHTLAEIIRAFCADALSSTINLNVDLDIMLAVLAQALLAALRARLPGYHAATPDTIQRRFLETSARSSPPAT
jgi:hypothetical protein